MRLLILCALALCASAHTIRMTGVVIHADDDTTSVTITAHLPLLQGTDPATSLARRLHLRLDNTGFHPTGIKIERDPASDTVTWTAHENRQATRIALDAPIFPDHPADTTVLLVYRGDRLTDRLTVNPGLTAILRQFVRMGVLHILSGPDHILFLLGLILAGGTVRQLLGIVTAFTLAHSLTLSLTALGVASLSPHIVEPLIALSIVVVGLENLLRPNSGVAMRIALAFGFGFFHGFGFAGALAEVGLPRNAIGWSLASFNIGVETGQACILALVLPLLRFLRPLARQYVSAGIALAGAFWFVTRIAGAIR